MTYYATEKGIRNLEKEITNLTKKSRELESKTQETAQICGDGWHDNPGLYALTDEADMRAKHINELFSVVNNCQRITYPKTVMNICIGSRVVIEDNERTENYEIVGYGESDPDNGKILYDTPLARWLIGKKVNDIFIMKIAGEQRKIKVLRIDPLSSS